MRTRTVVLPVAMLLVASAALAAPHLADRMTLQPKSRLWVEGTSTTRGYNCGAATFTTAVEAAAPGAAGAIVAGQKVVTTVALEVPAARLDCNNSTMNGHMHRALKVTEHPTIGFRLASYDLTPGAAGTRVTLRGPLTLAGVTKDIEMTADATDEGQGILRVTGTYELRMTEYGIRPPTLMLGTLKVHDQVKVGFDLFLQN